ESSPQMREVHDRMPVILRQDHWKTWIEGSPREAFALCRTWEDELAVEQTSTRWAGRGLMGMLPFE
ncbi:SOS response-associated peptidase family protein, partial [Klebsiella pneumoniae]|uniref:SOS response-associated peptidase family protein n=1 Tax=Klebsiella pneumoniae TaxID=573 RepID=UPI00385196D4